MTAFQAAGWALVHSLWQGAVLAAVLAAVLGIVPARAARTRYALAVATLVLMLALPLRAALELRTAPVPAADPTWITAVVERAPARLLGALGVAPVPVSHDPRGAAAASVVPLVSRLRAAFEPALPWVVAGWFVGVLILSLRLTSGWRTAQRLGTVGTRPAPPACAAALARLAARLRISRPVRVLESAVVQVPAVIGWLRPVVLLPASALTGLSPLQLDALLAHELAHVRRGDYLVNLLQTVIETLLFYHPAVWWVSARVRQEREHCCDDLAVTVCGDAMVYARALVGMEGLRVPPRAFAPAAAGGSLLHRVRRLVAPGTPEIFPRWAAGIVMVALSLSVAAGAAFAGVAAPRPPIITQAASGAAEAASRHSPQRATGSVLASLRALRDDDARRDAIERLVRRRWQAPDTLAALLEALALQGSDSDAQRDAVEALGELRDPGALERVRRLARVHASADVRRKAIDTYAEAVAPGVALDFLRDVLATEASLAGLTEALEELADLPRGLGVPVLIETAERHPSDAVRAEARRQLAELRDRDDD